MDLFKASTPKADPEQIERLKAWVYEAFAPFLLISQYPLVSWPVMSRVAHR